MAADAVVVGLGLALGAEPPDRIDEIAGPADEQHAHQPVRIDDQIVHGPAIVAGQDWQPEQLGKKVHHGFVSVCESSPPFKRAELRPRWTKNATMANSTAPITPSNVRMPQFMPCARAESEAP